MTQLLARYGPAKPDPLNTVIIEQQEWSAYSGGLTRWQSVAFLVGLLYRGIDWTNYQINCDMEDGRIVCNIHVYPLKPGLFYRLAVTHGELGERRIESVDVEENARLTLEQEISVRYPVDEIVSAEWLGDCFDAEFNVVPQPRLRIRADRRQVEAAQPVYGTVAVKYRTTRHTYELRIEKREEAIENLYSSIAYALVDAGAPVTEVLEPPPAASELEADCGYGGGMKISGPEDDGPGLDEPHANRKTVYEWCDPHRLISDDVTGV